MCAHEGVEPTAVFGLSWHFSLLQTCFISTLCYEGLILRSSPGMFHCCKCISTCWVRGDTDEAGAGGDGFWVRGDADEAGTGGDGCWVRGDADEAGTGGDGYWVRGDADEAGTGGNGFWVSGEVGAGSVVEEGSCWATDSTDIWVYITNTVIKSSLAIGKECSMSNPITCSSGSGWPGTLCANIASLGG